ncbi:PucR family transcriptional regulator [Thermomonospora umbrina]|uniref:PucR family transcriptional regulator n=1 Tax=Thermomonospora umbrina TaxID=111806 RepID=UPI000E2523EA|nr:PucR family transcriptional regulator [Thermomonospora umbrina]
MHGDEGDQIRRHAAIAAIEADLQSIAEYGRDLLIEEIPQYREVPPDEVLAGTVMAVRAAFASVMEDRRATPGELTIMGEIGARAARAGVPFHQMVHCLRLIAGHAAEVGNERAAQYGVEPALMRSTPRLWHWVVEALGVMGEEHQRIELEMVRHDRDRRAAFLADLFGGRLTGTELTVRAEQYGLDPNEQYLAFRAPIKGRETRRRIERAAEESGIAEIYQGDLVGVLPRLPRLGDEDLVAVGRALPLGSAKVSFAQASTALKVATAFRMTGVISIADVPIQTAVLESPDVTDIVIERCFGAFPGDKRTVLAQTLAGYLDHDLRITEAADALHVHPNTLRYRLRRFEEVSGLSLERISDVVIVWWALQYLRIADGRDTSLAA